MNEQLNTFYKGFNHFMQMDLSADKIIYKSGRDVYGCVDAARLRIIELGLQLTAKVTSHNTFVVE